MTDEYIVEVRSSEPMLKKGTQCEEVATMLKIIIPSNHKMRHTIKRWDTAKGQSSRDIVKASPKFLTLEPSGEKTHRHA